jgi:hypothetical protein
MASVIQHAQIEIFGGVLLIFAVMFIFNWAWFSWVSRLR